MIAVNVENSKLCGNLQLAEMVVGAIARYRRSSRSDYDKWFHMIENKVIESL